MPSFYSNGTNEVWFEKQLTSINSHLGTGKYEPSGRILDHLMTDKENEGSRRFTRDSFLENRPSYFWQNIVHGATMFPEKAFFLERSGVSLCTQGPSTRLPPLGAKGNPGSRVSFSDGDGANFSRSFDGNDRPTGPVLISDKQLCTVLESISGHRRHTLATRSSSQSDNTHDYSADKVSAFRRKKKAT